MQFGAGVLLNTILVGLCINNRIYAGGSQGLFWFDIQIGFGFALVINMITGSMVTVQLRGGFGSINLLKVLHLLTEGLNLCSKDLKFTLGRVNRDRRWNGSVLRKSMGSGGTIDGGIGRLVYTTNTGRISLHIDDHSTGSTSSAGTFRSVEGVRIQHFQHKALTSTIGHLINHYTVLVVIVCIGTHNIAQYVKLGGQPFQIVNLIWPTETDDAGDGAFDGIDLGQDGGLEG